MRLFSVALVGLSWASTTMAFLPLPPPRTPTTTITTTTTLYSTNNGGGFDFMKAFNDFFAQFTGEAKTEEATTTTTTKKEEEKEDEPPPPPPPEEVDVLVVGAGVSGSTTAFYLDKNGVDCLLAEARDNVGGNVVSKSSEGFQWEEGPNTFQPADHVMRAVVDLGIKDKLVLSDPSLPRYVYWEGQLYALPTGPEDILSMDLLSWPGKLRAAVGALGFVDPAPDDYEESVKEFVTRHLGEEAFERIVDPFVGGVYAGDPARLSVKAALSKVKQLEEVGGPGILDGFILRVRELKDKALKRDKDLPEFQNSQFGSFKGGLQTLLDAVAEKLTGKIRTKWSLKTIEQTESGDYLSSFSTPDGPRSVISKAVAITAPAHVINQLLRPLVPEVKRLESVYYPPVASVTLAYPKSAFKEPLKGFGHFIPRAMKVRTLGTIWSSSLFPDRVPGEYEMLLSYIGGSQDPEIAGLSEDQIVQQVHMDIKKILLKDDAPEPKVLACRVWPTAIPQYEKGHLEVIDAMEKAVEKFPGLFLGGNYKTGIAYGDCIQYGQEEAERIRTYLKEVLPPKPMYPYRY